MGQVPSNSVSLIETEDDAKNVQVSDPDKLAFATQTTLSLDDTSAILKILKSRFSNIKGPSSEDICYATTNRQHAVKSMAKLCDSILVIGAENSSNSLRLVEVALANGVKIAKLIPDEKSYSLGKLCKSLGIPMSDRHRASGDALATVQLFKLLLDKDNNKEIVQDSIKYFDNRDVKDKMNAILDAIPDRMGIYYIHNSDGKVIFIGRGQNLKSEVTKLFLKQSKRAIKIQERVDKVLSLIHI